MAIRFRGATPGTLMCLGATILLAIVSFNTPLLKTLYFLNATYSSGQYAGTLQLGTLGYCLTNGGSTTCVGPTVGYEFNPNQLLGISLFDIPETITHYLTYTLILHIIALAFAAASTIAGLLSHISTMSMMCFPTCLASITSGITLIALIIDLVMFYIAKSRIDAVSGASASIGICVWLTLVAWLLSGLSGCAYGIGRCCVGSSGRRESGDPRGKGSYDPRSDDMRLHAVNDEALRKKEQGLPSFQEYERTPLAGQDTEGDDKFLADEQNMPGAMPTLNGLRRDGSVVQGVGMGYGRRKSPAAGYQNGYAPNGYGSGAGIGGYPGYAAAGANLQRRLSGQTSAGDFVGVGAGGAGVDRPDYGEHHYGDSSYQPEVYRDPYAPSPYPYSTPYAAIPPSKSYNDSYTSYPSASTPTPMLMPTPAPAEHTYDPYGAGDVSADSHDPGPRVAQADPYDGYDDGLGAIGMAATAGPSSSSYPPQRSANAYEERHDPHIHAPRPQALGNPAATLLRSPLSPVDGAQHEILGGSGAYGHGYSDHQLANRAEEPEEDDFSARPPSYGAVAGASQYQPPPEKSTYLSPRR